VKCQGNRRSCRARVNLAGGARDREIVIRLTNTDLSLQAVNAVPKHEHVAYSLTDGHLARSGSEYVVTLSAASSGPQGSHLILTFG
jgi:ribosomal protein L18